MKRILILFVVALAIWPVLSAQAQQMCFQDRRVAEVKIGYVDIWGLGPDGGDAIYFKIDNGNQYSLNRSYNLDWPRGQAMYKLLMTAMAGGYRVRAYDHNYPYCDDIDELHIYR
ncbi:hypothetical protein AB4059_11840 [Lysobacter sp. 2RAF19]